MTSDWAAIRQEYEQGHLSQSALAKKYGLSRTAIHKRAKTESWQVAGCRLQVAGATTPPSPTSLPGDALSIAHTGLHQLAQHLQAETPLDIKDHKLLSDALAQYVKVLLIAPQEETQETGLFIDIGKLPAWKRMELRRLLASDAPQGEAI